MEIKTNTKSPRTNTYLGTFDCKSASDMLELAGLRRTVKKLNKDLRSSGYTEQYYVKAQGRGPRLGNPKYICSLPLPLALTCDAYMYKR